GWTGDLNAFAPSAAFLYDVRGVLRSWLEDLAAGRVREHDGWPGRGVPSGGTRLGCRASRRVIRRGSGRGSGSGSGSRCLRLGRFAQCAELAARHGRAGADARPLATRGGSGRRRSSGCRRLLAEQALEGVATTARGRRGASGGIVLRRVGQDRLGSSGREHRVGSRRRARSRAHVEGL
ncbi:alpha-L-rhamnosidase-related protein, partial [Clavibacter michiganensis]|uniref:alpha-L-rhamnosidase-related protein n=1 Tax=Clavibacter michiganensis TaxID=28447 RepID=UPI001365EE26